MLKLQWGLSRAVPETATVAWGARAIITHDCTSFDLLPDRQDIDARCPPLVGAMKRALNGPDGYLVKAQARFAELMAGTLAGTLRWDEEREHVLIDDGYMRIVADARASHGYLYIAAWLVNAVHPTAASCIGSYNHADTSDTSVMKWSHRELPPPVGADVEWSQRVGRATVVGYIEQHGWLMATVVPHETFSNGSERFTTIGVFGCDIVESDCAECGKPGAYMHHLGASAKHQACVTGGS